LTPESGAAHPANVPLRIATAPGTWGVETPGDPANPTWARVLDEVAAAGFDGVELGPVGYLPESPRALRAELARRELSLAGGFVMAPFHEACRRDEILHVADRTCSILAELDARIVVLIEAVVPVRSRAAGRAEAARRLDASGWRDLVDAVFQVARRMRRRYGVAAAFHPHAGTYVEFSDEVERLLEDIDPDLLGLCLDTGHAVYAGADPAEWCRRWGGRIRHVHLKDVRAPLHRAGWSFERAVGDGVFCPLGAGDVDLAATFDALDEIGYAGWATYEQDRTTATTRQAARDAAASLAHVRALGAAPEEARSCG
jgi:inosose dehydratase